MRLGGAGLRLRGLHLSPRRMRAVHPMIIADRCYPQPAGTELCIRMRRLRDTDRSPVRVCSGGTCQPPLTAHPFHSSTLRLRSPRLRQLLLSGMLPPASPVSQRPPHPRNSFPSMLVALLPEALAALLLARCPCRRRPSSLVTLDGRLGQWRSRGFGCPGRPGVLAAARQPPRLMLPFPP